jgi:chloride channel protein, CIC family
MAKTAASPGDPASIIRSRRFVVLLVLAALIGVVASLAAWGFLELIHQIQVGVYTDLPKDFGYDTAPDWWSLPVLAIAGVVTAFAIVRLPGRGGHLPANGLSGGVTPPVDLPGVILAALATIGLGVVLGPEAPLIALGSGLGLLAVRFARRDTPPEVGEVLAAAGMFAAMALIFASPIIAAIILIEAAGLGGPRLPLVLIPGLLAAGIGSLISIGMGSWTGLSTSAYALGPLSLPSFARPDIADFAWSILLAAAVAIVSFAVFRLARVTVRIVTTRPFVLVPVVGIAVSGLAMLFAETTGKSVNEVLFSGQDQLPGLVSGAATWSLSALALLVAFKGIAWAISLGSFRGGPTFPALFLGAAGGLMAAQLPGYSITPAVAVGIGAAVASVLRLPLSAVVLAALLTANTGAGSLPLVIVGVVVAYVITVVLSRPSAGEADAGDTAAPAAGEGAPASSGLTG